MYNFLFEGIEGTFLKSMYLFFLLTLIGIIIYSAIRINNIYSNSSNWNLQETVIIARLQKKNFSESEIIKYMKFYYLTDLGLYIFCLFYLLMFKFNSLNNLIIPSLIPSFILRSLEKSITKNKDNL